MKISRRVASPPPKPLLIYDGDCNFCKYWVARWRKITGERVDFLPLQSEELARRFPEVPRSELETAVHLIEPDGEVFSGAEAALRSRAQNPRHQMLWNFYRRSRFFSALAEFVYHHVSRHREFFSWLWGTHP